MATEEFTWADLDAFRRDVVILESLMHSWGINWNIEYSDRLPNEIEVFNSEFRRLLLLTAALARRILERLKNRSQFDKRGCGLIWEDARSLDKLEELKIRRACNQIIHADKTGFDYPSSNEFIYDVLVEYDEPDNILSYIKITSSEKGTQKVTLLNVFSYTGLCYELREAYKKAYGASKGD